MIETIKIEHPNTKVIIGGHSSGGGLAVRFGGSKYRKSADAYMLMSPFLKHRFDAIEVNRMYIFM